MTIHRPARIGSILALVAAASRAPAAPCAFVAVAAGEKHVLALDADGSVWAWGDNTRGQLGDPSTVVMRSTPWQIPGLSDIVQIDAGAFHSLALRSDGIVLAWGLNDSGELGDGTRALRAVPGPVSGLAGVTQVSAGSWHSLARLMDGTVRAWGLDTGGTIGDGDPAPDRLVPVEVFSLADVESVSAGPDLSLALVRDGTVRAWGRAVLASIPIPILGLSGVVQVAAGPEALALLGDGSVRTWDETLSPSVVIGLAGVARLSHGFRHALALLSDGTVAAWGNNSCGQIGNGWNGGSTTMPRIVAGLADVASVAAGSEHSVALLRDGSAKAWGNNLEGELGARPLVYNPEPLVIRQGAESCALDGVEDVVAGETQTVALTRGGIVKQWGYPGSRVPADVPGLSDVIQVATGTSHALALLADGRVMAWGLNTSGQLGLGRIDSTWQFTPQAILALSSVSQVSAGDRHSLALLADGTVKAWGAGGALGDGTRVDRTAPVTVRGISGAVQIAAGANESYAVLEDGTVQYWGALTTEVPGLAGVVQVSAGGFTKLALREDGSVMSWRNPGGDAPVEVPGLSEVVQVAAGLEHALALIADGSVRAWGRNWEGELGDRTRGYATTPVTSDVSDAVAIAAPLTGRYSMVLLADGTLRGFGLNENSQLGNDYSSWISTRPVTVECSGPEPIVAPAPEVEGLTITFALPGVPFVRQLEWTDDRASGDLLFDLVGGLLADLRRDRGFASAECIARGIDDASFTESLVPGSRWYLVGMRSTCAKADYGHASSRGGADPRMALSASPPCP